MQTIRRIKTLLSAFLISLVFGYMFYILDLEWVFIVTFTLLIFFQLIMMQLMIGFMFVVQSDINSLSRKIKFLADKGKKKLP